MWSLKVKGKDLYLPKTPYNQEEMEQGFYPLTNKPDRIGCYKYKGYAERLQRTLQDHEFVVVESPNISN